jgi:hypothetical protein
LQQGPGGGLGAPRPRAARGWRLLPGGRASGPDGLCHHATAPGRGWRRRTAGAGRQASSLRGWGPRPQGRGCKCCPWARPGTWTRCCWRCSPRRGALLRVCAAGPVGADARRSAAGTDGECWTRCWSCRARRCPRGRHDSAAQLAVDAASLKAGLDRRDRRASTAQAMLNAPPRLPLQDEPAAATAGDWGGPAPSPAFAAKPRPLGGSARTRLLADPRAQAWCWPRRRTGWGPPRFGVWPSPRHWAWRPRSSRRRLRRRLALRQRRPPRRRGGRAARAWAGTARPPAWGAWAASRAGALG